MFCHWRATKKKNKIKCLFIFPCELRLHKADLEFSGDRFNEEKQLVSDNLNRPLPSFLIMWSFSTIAEVAGWILRPLRSTCQCKLTNCQSLWLLILPDFSRSLLFSSDRRLHQLRPPVLRRRGEPDRLPLLRLQPHRGSLGLHHLPQVGLPALPLAAELPLQQASREEDGALQPVLASRPPHTVHPSQRDAPADQLLSQPASVSLHTRTHTHTPGCWRLGGDLGTKGSSGSHCHHFKAPINTLKKDMCRHGNWLFPCDRQIRTNWLMGTVSSSCHKQTALQCSIRALVQPPRGTHILSHHNIMHFSPVMPAWMAFFLLVCCCFF